MPVFIGCDLGTLGTKAAVVDTEGVILGSAFEETHLRYPRPGWVEQDFSDIERSAHRTIAAALADAGRVGPVAGVALSGQMAGVGAITSDFTPATRYDSWLDTRCEPDIHTMSAHATRVVELAGCPPTYSHGPKIRWWQRSQPDTFRTIARFVVPTSYVAARLCGLTAEDAFVDHTHLHFSNLADTARRQWSGELLDTFGIPSSKLPRIVAPTETIGEVTPDASATTGIPAGTPVAAGAGDTAAAVLGAGVTRPGQAVDLAGTASVFGVCVAEFRPDTRHHTVMTMPALVAGSYVSLAFINGGGLALRWFRDQLATAEYDPPPSYAELDTWAEDVPVGADGLMWHPHIQGRVLPPQPKARGSWVGLTAGHTRGHMYRAMLEGVAHQYGRWADLARADLGAALSETRAVGGGASSTVWNQIKADVLGTPWVPAHRQECGVLGDALIAAAATGHVDDLARTAHQWQSTAAPVHPDNQRSAHYAAHAVTHRALAEALEPVFRRD